MANRLIHPRFIGAYVYAITVDGVVRYIGKGRRYRAIEHFRWAREINRRREAGEKVGALPMHNRLAKAMRNGAVLGYEIIAHGLSDEAAYRIEAEEVGKAPLGQLWNLKPGGDGTDGRYIASLWKDDAFRKRVMSTRQQTMYGSAEWRDRQRANAVAQWADAEKKARFTAQHRRLWDDPVAAEDRRKLLREVWSDPEKKARKSALVASQWTPERRAAMAENRRRAWADPEFRAKASASIRSAKAKHGRPEDSLLLRSCGAEEVQTEPIR